MMTFKTYLENISELDINSIKGYAYQVMLKAVNDLVNLPADGVDSSLASFLDSSSWGYEIGPAITDTLIVAIADHFHLDPEQLEKKIKMIMSKAGKVINIDKTGFFNRVMGHEGSMERII